MKQKAVIMVLSVLLILTFSGCSNPLSDKAVSSGDSIVTSNINPQSSDAAGEITIMGKVSNISDDIITLSLLTKNEAASEAETSDSSSSDNKSDTKPSSKASEMQSTAPSSAGGKPSYTPTGDERKIEVVKSTNITLKSGKSGTPSDIKIGDILNVQMSGNTVKSIAVVSNNEKLASDIIAPASNESGLSSSSK